MPTSKRICDEILRRYTGEVALTDLLDRLAPLPVSEKPLPDRIPLGNDFTPDGLAKRRAFMAEQGLTADAICLADDQVDLDKLSGNIENYVGHIAMPLGLVGPLRVNGLYARGDYFVPLATHEGALVASCHRGAYAISHSGGASVACLTESVSRAPCFQFNRMADAGAFLTWVLSQVEQFQEIVDTTSSHCVFQNLNVNLCGKELYLIFEYTTGDAAGQNMVTLATEAICKKLVAEAPLKPRDWFLEGNLSGDKKATMISFLNTRGKKCLAEVVIKRSILERFLHVSPEKMFQYWQVSFMGAAQSGSIGVQGHYANMLAALFISCGQDPACVSEAAVGITRIDLTDEGDLYMMISLPNLIVGTVGGGTHLSTHQECLSMLGCAGTGSARKFAELCAATALAGELSIIAALAAGDFGEAHATYGRQK
jgi:hydroxymethylglutaryl-CoA reductase (NADPH)